MSYHRKFTFNSKQEILTVLPDDIIDIRKRKPEQLEQAKRDLQYDLYHKSTRNVGTTILPIPVVLEYWEVAKDFRKPYPLDIKCWMAFDGGTHYQIRESSCFLHDSL